MYIKCLQSSLSFISTSYNKFFVESGGGPGADIFYYSFRLFSLRI